MLRSCPFVAHENTEYPKSDKLLAHVRRYCFMFTGAPKAGTCSVARFRTASLIRTVPSPSISSRGSKDLKMTEVKDEMLAMMFD